MREARRFALLPLLAAALLAPACGNDSLTLPDVSRGVIDLSVEPNPAPSTQNPLTGSVSTSYRVTIAELNGLGGEVLFVSSVVFDPETGLQAALNYFDGADLVVFVGSKRVEAKSTLVVPQTTSYVLPDFRREANLVVSVQVKDDRGNLLNRSLLVKIE
jgi:hypothetical protein